MNVAELDCEFYTFSGHKAFGPSGIGALYGKKELLDAMPPYQGGGEMIRSVTFEKTEYAPAPARFEAGTPNIAGAVALGATVDYLEAIGMGAIQAYELTRLLSPGTRVFRKRTGLRETVPLRSRGIRPVPIRTRYRPGSTPSSSTACRTRRRAPVGRPGIRRRD